MIDDIKQEIDLQALADLYWSDDRVSLVWVFRERVPDSKITLEGKVNPSAHPDRDQSHIYLPYSVPGQGERSNEGKWIGHEVTEERIVDQVDHVMEGMVDDSISKDVPRDPVKIDENGGPNEVMEAIKQA